MLNWQKYILCIILQPLCVFKIGNHRLRTCLNPYTFFSNLDVCFNKWSSFNLGSLSFVEKHWHTGSIFSSCWISMKKIIITVAPWFWCERHSLNVCIVGTHKFHYFHCPLLPQMLIYILIQFLFICTLSFFMLARINRQTTFSQPIVSTDGWLGIKTVQLLVLCFYPPLHFMLHQIRKQSRSPPGLRIVDTESATTATSL